MLRRTGMLERNSRVVSSHLQTLQCVPPPEGCDRHEVYSIYTKKPERGKHTRLSSTASTSACGLAALRKWQGCFSVFVVGIVLIYCASQGQLLRVQNEKTIVKSNFDPKKETKMIIHGFIDTPLSSWVKVTPMVAPR